MEVTETLYAKDRKEFRAWLQENHADKKEIWLVYFKKHTGKPRIPYDDAVEEAICFGWIDSTVKKLDHERFCQRFTPRRKGSEWSDINIARARKMIEYGMMERAGSKKLPRAVLE